MEHTVCLKSSRRTHNVEDAIALAYPTERLVHLLHGLIGSGDLALSLVGLISTVLALEDALAVSGQLELGDLDVGGVDTDGDGGTVGLLALHLIDVDDPLEAVGSGDLTLTALEPTALHADLVVLAHGHGADVVLGAELLGQGGAHENAAHVAGGLEVSTAGLSAGTTLDAGHL
jgi:hypothetical protein